MAAGQRLLPAREAEPAAVVGDRGGDRLALAMDAHREESGAGVLGGVRRQFADYGHEQRVVGARRVGVDAQVGLEAAGPGGALDDDIEATREAAVGERRRMQAADRLAQCRHGLTQLLAGALELGGVTAAGPGVEILAGGEQCLQGVVVEALGELAAGPVLGAERVGEQPAARLRE